MPGVHPVLTSYHPAQQGDSCLGAGVEVRAGDRMACEQYCPVSDTPSSGEAAGTAFWFLVAFGLVTTALHSLCCACSRGASSQDEELLEW